MKPSKYKITNYCWESQAFELSDEYISHWVNQDGFKELGFDISNIDRCKALIGKSVETRLIPSFMDAINPVIIL